MPSLLKNVIVIRTDIAIAYLSHPRSQKPSVVAHYQQREREIFLVIDLIFRLHLFWTFPIGSYI